MTFPGSETTNSTFLDICRSPKHNYTKLTFTQNTVYTCVCVNKTICLRLSIINGLLTLNKIMEVGRNMH